MVMLLMVMAAVSELVNVIAFCPPRPPTGTKFQLSDVGATVAEAKQRAACETPSAIATKGAACLNEIRFANEEDLLSPMRTEDKALLIAQDNPDGKYIWPQDSRFALA